MVILKKYNGEYLVVKKRKNVALRRAVAAMRAGD